MSEKILPKVSIVIPVYNGANYLQESIDSALSQDYPNFEVIVVNDGSTDDGATEKIALSYGDRIRYFSKSNGGVSSALNFAIARMEGEYFSWLSHDDAYTSQKLSHGISLLSNYVDDNKKLISFCWGNYIDENGNTIRPFSKRMETDRIFTPDEMVLYMLRRGTMNGCCMLIPKIAFDEFGGFNEELRYSQDTLMWFTLFFNGYGMVYDDNPDVMYRLHRHQTSKTRRDLFEKDSVYIAKKLSPYLKKVNDNKLLYLYGKRLAKYNCPAVVNYMRLLARECRPFDLRQNLVLEAMLLYSKARVWLKQIRDRFI